MVREALKERFVAVLAELGGSAGNGRMREALGWQDETYAQVHAALVAEGVVVKGRGRGGSVSLAAAEGDAEDDAGVAAAGATSDAEASAVAAEPAAEAEPPRRGRRPKAEKPAGRHGNGGDLGFEAELFKAADKLRGNLEPSEYKHVALGLIFLKYISEAFEAQRAKLLANPEADPEDREEYLADNVFWVPEVARWSNLQANARIPEIVLPDGRKGGIGMLIDAAMEAIEKANGKTLKDVLPKTFGRTTLNSTMLGELVDLFSNVDFGGHDRAKDLLGRAYEYFLSGFAGAEGKRGGEFFTPRSVVKVLVEMLEPYKGRVYDPCCGSGGMFVQAEKFIKEHADKREYEKVKRDIAVYGQESNHTTWRLAKMNLAVRGIDADIRWNNEGSFHRDELPDLKADFVMANPPFNVSDWGGERLKDDRRWAFGTPPAGNANYAWLQHIFHHLAPRGTAGVVLANGSMSSQQSGEGEIRRAMIEADVVDCMVALPGQLFYSTQIPACLWFLARSKSANGHRDRRGEILFVDARKLGHMVDRTRRNFSDDDVAKITDAYHRWRSKAPSAPYEDVPGFCKAATLAEVRAHGHVLTPGRYVGAEAEAEDEETFAVRFARLRERLEEQFAEGRRLEQQVRQSLGGVAAGG